MTPTEKKYRKNLGKLYVVSMTVWNWDKKMYETKQQLVMPFSLDNRGGWWHYNVMMLSEGKEKIAVAAEFIRKSRLYTKEDENLLLPE
jgi:hypothetical protein